MCWCVAGFLVVDLCGYDNADIIKDHYLKNLKSEVRDTMIPATVRRYVLPLNAKPEVKITVLFPF